MILTRVVFTGAGHVVLAVDLFVPLQLGLRSVISSHGFGFDLYMKSKRSAEMGLPLFWARNNEKLRFFVGFGSLYGGGIVKSSVMGSWLKKIK